jgi:hypothetical protein
MLTGTPIGGPKALTSSEDLLEFDSSLENERSFSVVGFAIVNDQVQIFFELMSILVLTVGQLVLDGRQIDRSLDNFVVSVQKESENELKMLSSSVPVDLPRCEIFVIRYRIAEKVASRMHKLHREFLSKQATFQMAGMKAFGLPISPR